MVVHGGRIKDSKLCKDMGSTWVLELTSWEACQTCMVCVGA